MGRCKFEENSEKASAFAQVIPAFHDEIYMLLMTSK